ncbi:hypothetical protein LLH23_15335 [bacterium]|nr:hypothetical protein [bacterium]
MACVAGVQLYLDLAEHIVRQATDWQTPAGMVGDPYNAPGVESVTATARYCAALGHLLAAGRCGDLRDSAVAAMDWCCGELARHIASGEQWPAAQFNVKDMMVLYGALAGSELELAPLARWAAQLTFDPGRLYYGERNFVFYSTAAETLRLRHRLTSAWEYVDALLDSQMAFWTPEGLYRDPNDPVTYDLTVRQSLAMTLHYGYAGRHTQWMREVLHRGALTTLQLISPCGVAPYGGRSNQFHMMEGMIAYFAEWQARQETDGDLAGALRGMALSCAEGVRRWVLQTTYCSLKHNMGEAEMFGQDGFGPGHNAHSGYGLLAANLFAGAYHVADESIRPTASSGGARLLHLGDAFHRVFATVGDVHIQIDTRGQAGHDATGLGRFHRRGVPIETALNMSLVREPGYHMPLPTAPRSVALGAGWPCADGWRYLSEADRESHDVTVTTCRAHGPLEFTVCYRFRDPEAWGVREVLEHYSLSARGLACRIEVPGVRRLRLQVPVIETDGEARSAVTVSDDGVEVRYRGHRYVVSVEATELAAQLRWRGRDYALRVEGLVADRFMEPWRAPNRNGVYRVAVFEVAGEALTYQASLV